MPVIHLPQPVSERSEPVRPSLQRKSWAGWKVFLAGAVCRGAG